MKKLMGVMALCGVAMLAAGCEKTAKNGDTVVIDFAGFLGEEQLIGAKVGETRDVNITFPQNYVPNLAGKDVVFKVTIKDIQK